MFTTQAYTHISYILTRLVLYRYPPSLVYLLCTLGINCILLSCFFAIQLSSSTTTNSTSTVTLSSSVQSKISSFFTSKWNPLMVFGTSALFFYILHFYIYAMQQYFLVSIGVLPKQSKKWETSGGLTFLPFMGCWLLGLVILYPICAGYARFKNSCGPDSVFRFF